MNYINQKLEYIRVLMGKIPYDKSVHINWGVVIFMLSHLYYSSVTSLVIVTVIAVLNEIRDRFTPGHTSSYKDTIATVVGGLLGYGCTL